MSIKCKWKIDSRFCTRNAVQSNLCKQHWKILESHSPINTIQDQLDRTVLDFQVGEGDMLPNLYPEIKYLRNAILLLDKAQLKKIRNMAQKYNHDLAHMFNGARNPSTIQRGVAPILFKLSLDLTLALQDKRPHELHINTLRDAYRQFNARSGRKPDIQHLPLLTNLEKDGVPKSEQDQSDLTHIVKSVRSLRAQVKKLFALHGEVSKKLDRLAKSGASRVP